MCVSMFNFLKACPTYDRLFESMETAVRERLSFAF